MSNYKLITDGAYSSKLDQGGLGLVFLKDDKLILRYSKMYKHTTNNQMELGAIITGLKCITKPIDNLTIVSDSMYCIGCATKGWKRSKSPSKTLSLMLPYTMTGATFAVTKKKVGS